MGMVRKMKKIKAALWNKVVLFGILIVIQMAVTVGAILLLSANWTILYNVFRVISLLAVLWVLNSRDNPSYKLAWVVAIFLFPLLGGAFYWLFGRKRVSHGFRRKMENYSVPVRSLLSPQNHFVRRIRTEAPDLARQASYIRRMSGYPVWQGTSADFLPSGEKKFAVLKEELRQAQRFIFLEYFIIGEGQMWAEIETILQEKAASGVAIFLMYDDLGSNQVLPHNLKKRLEQMGIRVTVFNPFLPRLSMMFNYRDHRKICVIDGNVGFTGGINLADEYINVYPKHGHWKDTAVVLRGEAVWSLTVMFLSLWGICNEEQPDFSAYRPTRCWPTDGYIQPFDDSPLDRRNVSENAYMQMIYNAKQYIYLTSPYLILDNEMVTALCTAAQSGVDVRIITPFVADKWFVHPVTQSYYTPLLAAGVKIYEYTPGFIHAKMAVSDSTMAIVGTANLDYRSFYLHFECGVAFYHSSVVGKVERDFLHTQEKSTQVSQESLRNVPFWRRLERFLLRIFSPFM